MKSGSTFQEAVLAAFRSGIFSVWYMLFCMLSAGLTSWSWEEEWEVSPIFFSLRSLAILSCDELKSSSFQPAFPQPESSALQLSALSLSSI